MPLVALLVAAGAAALGLALASAGHAIMGGETIACLLLGVLIVTPVVVRALTGRFDPFEPVVVISGVYFIYFVVGPLVRFGMGELTFLGYDFQAEYLRGFGGVALGVASMWLGYALPVGPRPAPLGAPADAVALASLRPARRLGWALVGGAFVGMLLWSFVGGRSLATFFLPGILGGGVDSAVGTDVAYFFLAIEWFIPAVLVLLATGGLRGAVWPKVAVALVTIVYVSIGFRYRIVVLWLAVAMLYFLRRGTRPSVRQLALPGLALFVLSGWVSLARSYFRSAGTEGNLDFSLGHTLVSALADTRIFETFIALTQLVPTFQRYAGFAPVTYVFILPIPRALWPDKPQPEWLDVIRTSIGTEEAVTAGAAVPHFGEYYLSFGWIGVSVGMLLFGVAAKWLWRWLQAAPRDPWRQVIFAVNNALIFQIIIRGYLAQIVQEWCFIVLPAIAVAWVARRRGRAALRARALAPAAPAVLAAPGGEHAARA